MSIEQITDEEMGSVENKLFDTKLMTRDNDITIKKLIANHQQMEGIYWHKVSDALPETKPVEKVYWEESDQVALTIKGASGWTTGKLIESGSEHMWQVTGWSGNPVVESWLPLPTTNDKPKCPKNDTGGGPCYCGTEDKCEHGKGITEYCQLCGRINGGGL